MSPICKVALKSCPTAPALSDDGETAHGSIFIVNVPDRASAQEFSNGDPFTRDGVFSSINITRVRKGIWQPDAAEGA